MQSDASRKRKQRWISLAIVAVLTVGLLVALLPAVIAATPLRNLLVRGIARKTGAKVTVGAASLGWLSDVRLTDVNLANSLDQPVGQIGSIHLDRSVWRLLRSPSDLGTLSVDDSHVTVIVKDGATNLHFSPSAESASSKARRRERNRQVTIRVNRARLVLAAEGLSQPRTLVEDLNLVARLDQSKSGRFLDVEPFTVLDQSIVSPELCDLGLKYVAPILANTSWVRGSVSARLTECHLDLDQPQQCVVEGRLVIHSVETGPKNPLIQSIGRLVTGILKLDEFKVVRLADNSVVDFHVVDGRVYHEGLAFGLPGVSSELVLKTEGSVGFDGSLDMLLQVPLPLQLLGDSPLAKQLGNQTLRVPIRGTLDKPEVQFEGDGQTVSELLARLAQSAANNELNLKGVLDKLRESRSLRRSDRTEADNTIRRRRGGLLDRLRVSRDSSASENGQDNPPSD